MNRARFSPFSHRSSKTWMLLAIAVSLPACHERKGSVAVQSTGDYPRVRISPAGNPIVAWQHGGPGTPQIYLRGWDGAQWGELGGSASDGGVSGSPQAAHLPSLALESPSGTPVVAWSDSGGTNYLSELYLKRWNGAQWVEIGGSTSGGGISNFGLSGAACHECSLALDTANNPAVAWVMTTAFIGEFQLYFKRWNGAQWAELGGSATGTGLAATVFGFPGLAIDSGGNPVIAWTQSVSGVTPTVQIYLKRWNGSQWVEQAGSATAGGLSQATGLAEAPSLALDAAGNPIVAWEDGTSGLLQIYLRQWDGTQWVELGGSATGGGVSGTTGLAQSASLAVDSGGLPVVAWTDTRTGNAEVYLKRWDGAQWVEIGGSATGGGISNSPGASDLPSIALDASGNPVVAWRDSTPGRPVVYVKRWNGAQWAELAGSAGGSGVIR